MTRPTSEGAAAGSAADDPDLGAFVDAAARLLGIAVEPSWREGVVANLAVTARAARLVAEFPLDDELEPAPVFSP
jgi:hypothetical protein